MLREISPLECGHHLLRLALAEQGGQPTRWDGTRLEIADPDAAVAAILAHENVGYPPERGWPWMTIGRANLADGYERAVAAIGAAVGRTADELAALATGAPAITSTWLVQSAPTRSWSLGLLLPSATICPVSAWVAVLLGRLAVAHPDMAPLIHSPRAHWRGPLSYGPDQHGMLILPTWSAWRPPESLSALLRADVDAWVADDIDAWAYVVRQPLRGPAPSYCAVALAG